MKNTLLGIKMIGWLCVIGGIFAFIAAFKKESILWGFMFALNFIVGMNLLKKKEAARKFMVFLTSFSIVILLATMLLIPNILLGKREEYGRNLQRYKEIQVKISKLQEEKPVNEYELEPLMGEANSLKISLDRYPEFEKIMAKSFEEDFELNTGNITGISYLLFVVYYLTRPYVKQQFS